jgi:protein involved in polysaccharide export with SLBB domain
VFDAKKRLPMSRLLALLLVVCFMGTEYGIQAAQAQTVSTPSVFQLKINRAQAARKYLLGPYDALSVTILDAPEYDQKEMVVQPDGKLTIAPLGSINVTGLTVEELNDLLIDKYKFYLNDPKVTIRLDRTKPLVVQVAGAVLKPGSVELITNNLANTIGPNTEVANQRHTPLLSTVLLSAGGVSYDADIEHISIKNELDGTEMEVNLLKFLKEGDASQDVYLMTGDTVHVPRMASPLAIITKFFNGPALHPERYPLRCWAMSGSRG